jgi:hypothetical protein
VTLERQDGIYLEQGGAVAARLAHNQEVAGASPVSATRMKTVSFPDRQRSAASSSGRTPEFGSGNDGSNPSAAPNIDQMETGDVAISERQSDAIKRLALDHFGVRSAELENKRAAADNERIQRKLDNKNRF